MRVKICRRGNTGLPDFGHFFPIGKKYNFFWVGYSIPMIISISKGIIVLLILKVRFFS